MFKKISDIAGSSPFENCNSKKDLFNFSIQNKTDMWTQSLVMSDVVVSSHLDLLKKTASISPDLALEFGAAIAVEARHNAFFRIRAAAGIGDLQARLPRDWAVAWVRRYLKDASACPLPNGMVRGPPRLECNTETQSTTATTGKQIELSWNGTADSSPLDGRIVWLNQLYTPTYSEIGPFLNSGEGRQSQISINTTIPKGLQGVAFVAVLPDKRSFIYEDFVNRTVTPLAGPAVIQII